MPQIWLTYDEMSDAFGMPRNTIRDNCAELGLARMKSSDGTTRARLSPGLASQYLSGLVAKLSQEPVGLRHERVVLEAIVRDQIRQPSVPHAKAA